VVDTGVDPNQADLLGAVSSQSTDVYASRNAPAGEDTHGTYIAGIIASRFNGMGTIGVAYQSTILGVRIDTPGTCATNASPNNDCSFDDRDIATGIDYARTHGARVINLSLGGPTPMTDGFQQALSRAVAAGIVVTVAAGNDSAPSPDWPGRYATDSRYAGSVIAVGATDQTGQLASFSNQAGVTANGYVAAPGDKLISGCDGSSCWELSGTSFSSPMAAGALALLLQAFPNLTGREAVNILLTTADDLGAAGVDPVYGHGLIDLAKAFQPIGTLSVATSATRQSAAVSMVGSSLGSAFGDAVSITPALQTVGFDAYRRMFAINLADGYPARAHGLISGWTAPVQTTAAQTVAAPAPGVRLTLAAGSETRLRPPDLRQGRFQAMQPDRSDVQLELTAGPLSLTAWRGQDDVAPSPALQASWNAFASLSRPQKALGAALNLGGGLSIDAEAGTGGHYAYFGMQDLRPASYVMAGLRLARRDVATSISVGRLDEPQGPLGSLLPTFTAFSLPASTDFVSIRTDWTMSRRLMLSAEGGVGSTRATGQLLALQNAAISSNWRVTARFGCLYRQTGCTGLELEAAQPTRIEGGAFTAHLAQVPAAYDDPLVYTERRFSASPSGREIDLRLGLDRAFKDLGSGQINLLTVFDRAHQAGAPVSLGVAARWRSRF